MNKLLLATNNRGKVAELRALLADLGVDLLTPGDAGVDLQVDESGRTYRENAERKAIAFASRTGIPSLADDSGLEVDALGGAPGLRSARYVVRPAATDADRRAFLLENLSPHPRPWTARFHAAIAIALPGGESAGADGECQGEIIPEERGSNGFGYDPIFLVGSTGYTMAELSMEQKNRISHRATAVRNVRPILMDLLSR